MIPPSRERMADARARSDAELLASIARGDLGALGEVFDRHHERVWRVLARAGAPAADVDDLVQATFLELPKIAGAFDGRESCAGWLCGIAVRLASRRRRSIGRMLAAVTSFGRVAPLVASDNPEADAARREELRTFGAALAKLSPTRREAFVLVELEGLSAEDAARALDVPAATVRTRLFRAKADLRTAMKEGGVW